MYVKFVGRVTIKVKNYFGRLCSCNSIIVSLASITFFCLGILLINSYRCFHWHYFKCHLHFSAFNPFIFEKETQ